MGTEQWLLPGGIVLVKFLLKLFVDNQTDFPEFIEGLLALPLDIAFMAASLLAGLIILDVANVKAGLGIFVVALGIAMLAAFLWRRSSARFVRQSYGLALLYFGLNITFALGLTIFVVNLLNRGSLA